MQIIKIRHKLDTLIGTPAPLFIHAIYTLRQCTVKCNLFTDKYQPCFLCVFLCTFVGKFRPKMAQK